MSLSHFLDKIFLSFQFADDVDKEAHSLIDKLFDELIGIFPKTQEDWDVIDWNDLEIQAHKLIDDIYDKFYNFFPSEIIDPLSDDLILQYENVTLIKLILIIIFLTIVHLIAVIIAAGISSLVERKVFASVQRRQGPAVVGFGGILQFLADGIKLALKEVISPYPSTYFTFIFAPILVFVISMLGWTLIPTNFNYVFLDFELNILWSLTFSSLGVYGLILAGWSSNSKYSFLGSLRSAAQMVSYEVSLGFIIICLGILNGSFNYTKTVLAQYSLWFFFVLFPLALAFFVSMLAETNRAPFDLPEAEAELVAGYNLEYSSLAFALFFLGEYSNMSLMSGLFILFFLGGLFFLPQFFSYLFIKFLSYINYFILNIVKILEQFLLFFADSYFWFKELLPDDFFDIGNFIFAFKIVVLIIIFVLIRASYPRFRYDHLMQIGWKIFLPLTLGYVLFLAGILYSFKGLPLNLVENLDFIAQITYNIFDNSSFYVSQSVYLSQMSNNTTILYNSYIFCFLDDTLLNLLLKILQLIKDVYEYFNGGNSPFLKCFCMVNILDFCVNIKAAGITTTSVVSDALVSATFDFGNSGSRIAVYSENAQRIIYNLLLYAYNLSALEYTCDINNILSAKDYITGTVLHLNDYLHRDWFIDIKYLEYLQNKAQYIEFSKTKIAFESEYVPFPKFILRDFLSQFTDHPKVILNIRITLEALMAMWKEKLVYVGYDLANPLARIAYEVVSYFYPQYIYFMDDNNVLWMQDVHTFVKQIVPITHMIKILEPSFIFYIEHNVIFPPMPPYGIDIPSWEYVQIQLLIYTLEQLMQTKLSLVPMYGSANITEMAFNIKNVIAKDLEFDFTQASIHAIDALGTLFESVMYTEGIEVATVALILYLITGNALLLSRDFIPTSAAYEIFLEGIESSWDFLAEFYSNLSHNRKPLPFTNAEKPAEWVLKVHELNMNIATIIELQFCHYPGVKAIPIQDILGRRDLSSLKFKRILRAYSFLHRNDGYVDSILQISIYYALMEWYCVEYGIVSAFDIHVDSLLTRKTKDWKIPPYKERFFVRNRISMFIEDKFKEHTERFIDKGFDRFMPSFFVEKDFDRVSSADVVQNLKKNFKLVSNHDLKRKVTFNRSKKENIIGDTWMKNLDMPLGTYNSFIDGDLYELNRSRVSRVPMQRAPFIRRNIVNVEGYPDFSQILNPERNRDLGSQTHSLVHSDVLPTSFNFDHLLRDLNNVHNNNFVDVNMQSLDSVSDVSDVSDASSVISNNSNVTNNDSMSSVYDEDIRRMQLVALRNQALMRRRLESANFLDIFGRPVTDVSSVLSDSQDSGSSSQQSVPVSVDELPARPTNADNVLENMVFYGLYGDDAKSPEEYGILSSFDDEYPPDVSREEEEKKSADSVLEYQQLLLKYNFDDVSALDLVKIDDTENLDFFDVFCLYLEKTPKIMSVKELEKLK